MGGIGGLVRFDRPATAQAERLAALRRALRHRGPAGGEEVFTSFAALTATRLSQLPPNRSFSSQPLQSADRRFALVYDGEIYNRIELCSELGSRFPFCRHSGAELLLAAWTAWGELCLERLDGMFAFFLWDEENKRGYAARDGLGVKPLVYRHTESELVFASEAKALLPLAGTRPRAHPEAILEYLTAPALSGVERPMFDDLQILPAGHLLTIDREGLEQRPFWDFEVPRRFEDHEEWLAEELRRRLGEAVHAARIGEKGVGLFLSGGIDSTFLAALASRQRNTDESTSGELPPAFIARFAGQDRWDYRASLTVTSDDTPYARDAAWRFGFQERLVEVDRRTLGQDLHHLAVINDALPAFEQELSQYHLARTAGSEVTAVLTGDGADELHFGHAFLLDEVATRSPERLLHRLADAPIRREILADPVAHFGRRYRDLCATGGHVWGSRTQRLSATAYLIVKRWLPRLLHNVDIHTMAWGLEARLPFTTARLVDLARRVEPLLGLRDGTEKWLLRRAATGIVPASFQWRRQSSPPKDQASGRFLQLEADRRLGDAADFIGTFLDLERIRALCDRQRSPSEKERALLFRVIVLSHWAEHYGVRAP